MLLKAIKTLQLGYDQLFQDNRKLHLELAATKKGKKGKNTLATPLLPINKRIHLAGKCFWLMHNLWVSEFELHIVAGHLTTGESTDPSVLHIIANLKTFLVPELLAHLQKFPDSFCREVCATFNVIIFTD